MNTFLMYLANGMTFVFFIISFCCFMGAFSCLMTQKDYKHIRPYLLVSGFGFSVGLILTLTREFLQ